MTPDPKGPTPSSVDANESDAQASILMKRGIGLLRDAQPGAIAEALACFDRALELRRQLPIDTVPAFRYGLAACWLNRADALMRLGDPGQVISALRGYDEAVALLGGLPLDADPRFRRRLAIAHQNRGLALQAQGGAFSDQIVAAFTEAIAVLDHDRTSLLPDRQYLLAAIWMNLANARVSDATDESGLRAQHAALRAIALVTDLEVDDADAAEVGLKARHVLCRTIARRLSRPVLTDETIRSDVHVATDAVDDGLNLARQWERKGVDRFRGVACDLFRFGARVYEQYQPQFLQEFILDNTDPAQSSPAYVQSTEMRSAAEEALRLASRAGRSGLTRD